MNLIQIIVILNVIFTDGFEILFIQTFNHNRILNEQKTLTNLTNLKELVIYPNIHYAQIRRYERNEEELKEVLNMKTVFYIIMRNIGQKNIPVFCNLLRIRTINLSQNKLTKVLSNVFSFTSVLHILLYQNNIDTIEKHSFGSGLLWLDLACNNLSEFSIEWFRNPTSLKRLHLAGNKLSFIKENTFSNFISLNDINLSNNFIKLIGEGAFSGSKQYDWMFLNNNNIFEFNPKWFHRNDITTINFINFENNSFSCTHNLTNSVVNVKMVSAYGNPWLCHCYDEIRKQFLRIKSTFLFDSDFCQYYNDKELDYLKIKYNNKKCYLDYCNRTFYTSLEL